MSDIKSAPPKPRLFYVQTLGAAVRAAMRESGVEQGKDLSHAQYNNLCNALRNQIIKCSAPAEPVSMRSKADYDLLEARYNVACAMLTQYQKADQSA